jgi:hypothetical protein
LERLEVVEEVHSMNKELDADDGEGGGAHDDDVVVVVDVDVDGAGVDDDEAAVVLAHGDSLEESRWKREKDSEIPPWLVPVTSTGAVEKTLFFVS